MLNLLLVEDDRVDQLAMKKALEKADMAANLILAEDGSEGLKNLRRLSRAKVRSCTIVVLDLNLPRMNGLEFLKAVRTDEKLKETIVFILSTSEDPKDLSHAYDFNIAGYIVKQAGRDGYEELVNFLDGYQELVRLPHCREQS